MPIRKVVIDRANRLYQMPPELLAFVRRESPSLFQGRTKVIELASFAWPIGLTDDEAPDPTGLLPATETLLSGLREELAAWFARTHQVNLKSDKEIFIGGGISSIVQQLALAYIDAGDVAFVPGLGIGLYRSAVTACDGEPVAYTISGKDEWRPQFDRLTTSLGRVARLLFLNSPHNPTGAELSEKELADLAWLAGRENILLVNDAAYAGLSSRPPASLMAVRGGRKVGIELGSFSYQFGLPPLPFGFAVGSHDVIEGLRRVTQFQRPYLPRYFVDLAMRAIRHHPGDGLTKVRERVTKATAQTEALLDLLKLHPTGLATVPFTWARIERRSSSVAFARGLLRRHRILVVPGSSFGENGAGYIRLSLLAEPADYSEAVKRAGRRRILKPRENA